MLGLGAVVFNWGNRRRVYLSLKVTLALSLVLFLVIWFAVTDVTTLVIINLVFHPLILLLVIPCSYRLTVPLVVVGFRPRPYFPQVQFLQAVDHGVHLLRRHLVVRPRRVLINLHCHFLAWLPIPRKLPHHHRFGPGVPFRVHYLRDNPVGHRPLSFPDVPHVTA